MRRRMFLVVCEVFRAMHSRVAGPCRPLNYSGCAASGRTDADAFEVQRTHFPGAQSEGKVGGTLQYMF